MQHRKWKFRAKHVIDAIAKIEAWTCGISRDAFLRDEKTISAVVTQFQIIGEASQHIPPEVKSRYPGIEWPKIRGMRNILVHDYDRINVTVVWDAIQIDLPVFKQMIEELYEKETDQ